jgi:hypothetical protein
VKRSGTRALSVLVLLALMDLLTAGSAFAAHTANCSDGPGQVNRWSGQQLYGAKHGVGGILEAQSLYECTSPGFAEISGSFQFVNVEGNGFNSIVQIGVGRCRNPFWDPCTGNMELYRAWGRDSSAPGCSGMATRAPTAVIFANYGAVSHDVLVWDAAGKWRYYDDGNQLWSIKDSAICWTPRDASWFGESFDFGDAIGGLVSDKYRIGGMKYANEAGGAFYWTNFDASQRCNLGPGAPDTNGPPFYCDIEDPAQIATWTDR